MTVTVEKTSVNQAKLTITIDNEAYEDAMQKAYVKVRNQVNIPGFRQGKAPRPVIERYYSEAVFYDEACNIAVPDAYDKAVADNGLHPVDQPQIEVLEIGSGKGIQFTAEITLKPEVTLGKYKELGIEKPIYYTTEEDVEAELKRAQDRVARWVEVDRPIESGDRIMLDYSGSIDGEVFPGGSAENQPLEIGSGRFIPGFEEKLVGLKKDEEADVSVMFPTEYHAAELAGKPAVFHVKIREIKGKQLPEMDDEFAKDVSEFDSLEEYKADIRKNLEESNKHKAEHEYEDKLVEEVCANASVDIPQVMIDRQAARMAQEFEYRLAYQGIKMEEYLKMTQQTPESVVEQYLPSAEKAVRSSLVLEAVGKAEGIEAGDDELQAELAKMADARKQSQEELEKTIGEEDKEYIKGNIIMRKTLGLIAGEPLEVE